MKLDSLDHFFRGAEPHERSIVCVYLAALETCGDVDGVLGESLVVHPPNPDFGYDETPGNVLTFACLGADGVHYAILTRDGHPTEDAAVIQISPMDEPPYQVLSATFLLFLADGCGVPAEEMERVLTAGRSGQPTLVAFLRERFDMSRLWDEERSERLQAYLAQVVPKG